MPFGDFLSGKRLPGDEALKGISSCDVGSSDGVSAAGPIWLSSLITSRGKCTRGAFTVEVLVPPTASQSHWIVVGCRRKVQKAACPFSLNFQTLLWCLHFDLLPKWDQGVVNYSRRRNKVSALFVGEKKVCPGLWRTR